MTKHEKRIIIILLAFFSIIFFVLFALLFNKDNIVRRGKFVAPKMDATAVEGNPEGIDKQFTYQEMLIKEDYVVGLCATPKVERNILTIYFTSNINNKNLLKVRIFDKNGVILGESGLIKPNSYIKDIELNRYLEDNESISIKVMSYEKDTYYSNGSFKLNVFVHK